MIFLVTAQTKLFECNEYKTISVEESLAMLNKCEILQYDSETTGRDAHICDILCIQFGSDKYDFQMVIDCTSIDIMRYKNILEDKFLIGQNLKFDVQFLYCKNIIPRRVYDTMIVEQLLYLGYPSGIISYSLSFQCNGNQRVYVFKCFVACKRHCTLMCCITSSTTSYQEIIEIQL